MKVTGAWLALGLGSNLGQRLENLRSAVRALQALPGLDLEGIAPVYETEPVDCPPGSPMFLNTAVEGHYAGDVFQLLRSTQGIEDQLGRTRHTRARNEARPVDIDLLIIEGVTLDSTALTLPHPRMEERLFVLQPLADLRPDLILSDNRPITQLIQRLSSASTNVRKLERTL